MPNATETITKTKAEKKWGKDVINLGFCMIPSLLLQAQKRLGLNPTQLAILLQLADYWLSSNTTLHC